MKLTKSYFLILVKKNYSKNYDFVPLLFSTERDS
jgi:hypothetical protein